MGRLYPEEEIVYNTLRGTLRREFVLSNLERLKEPFLDLGCNRGYYLSKYRPGKPFGVDIAFSVLSQAKARCQDAKLVQGDGQDLAFFRSRTFNSVLCSEVLEHVSTPQRLLSECFRILKSGGTLLITTPNFSRKRPEWVELGEMRRYGINGVHGELYFHTAFRPSDLKSMTEKVGFLVLELGTIEKEVKYATRVPVVFFHVIRSINNMLLKGAQIDRLNRLMLEKSSFQIYKICKAVGLNSVLVRLVKEGVRTYLVGRRP